VLQEPTLGRRAQCVRVLGQLDEMAEPLKVKALELVAGHG
jgi:hypothetical protein